MTQPLFRREWDSNPRGVAPKRFSRPPRYDRFDNPAYLVYLIMFKAVVMTASALCGARNLSLAVHFAKFRPRQHLFARSLCHRQRSQTVPCVFGLLSYVGSRRYDRFCPFPGDALIGFKPNNYTTSPARCQALFKNLISPRPR